MLQHHMLRLIRTPLHSRGGALLVLVWSLLWPGESLAQIDICGCQGNPSTPGAFDTANAATYPPGTTTSFDSVSGIGFVAVLRIPLPLDGRFIFDSFRVGTDPSGRVTYVRFGRNAANTPVTLLVTGDVTIDSLREIQVNGEPGSAGADGVNGVGGLGGQGSFRGGDGAYQLVNVASDGGAGLGPGGGAAGTAAPLTSGGGGTFVGVPDLLPPVGGSGGGGGASASGALGCAAGGGGGGGGVLVIAANGTITVNGRIFADGGPGGPRRTSTSCASSGSGGSGGAIRLLASTITGSGSLFARGGTDPDTNQRAGAGAIRLEAFINTLAANADPVASRTLVPGALANPLQPSVDITTINGRPVPQHPQGVFGGADVLLSAPGPVIIDLGTTGVPSGTVVDVTVKPRVGGAPTVEPVTLRQADCDGVGNCFASAVVDLPAGAYVVEAQATFRAP